MVQFVEGQSSLATGAPLTDQHIGTSYASWMVDIRDVWLNAGSTYTFTVTGGLSAIYLLGSEAADQASWTQVPATAAISATTPTYDLQSVQTATLTVSPSRSDWYGALFVRNGWVGAPVTVRLATA